MTNAMSAISIPLDRSKAGPVFLISVAFVVVGGWMVLSPKPIDFFTFDIPQWFVQAVGALSVLFFSLGAVGVVHKLRDREPGLIIDARGITDNSSLISAGLIRWDDVRGVRPFKQFAGPEMLLVEVSDPDRYIARRGGPLRRLVARLNHRFYGSPVFISSSTLAVDYNALVARVQQELQARQG